MNPLSDGTLLGGRVRYAQPTTGYRTGIEPVLLAAAIPAHPGERVLEAGTGAGAGLLCLMARVPHLLGMGVEIDPALAAIARANVASNGFPGTIHAMDVAAATPLGPVAHAFANPPWHDPAGTAPSHPARQRAKHQTDAGLAPWIQGLAAIVPDGTLTLALPAALLARAVVLFTAASFGQITIIPLWPKADAAAKLILVQARRGHGATRMAAGLVLHRPEGGYTEAAEAVLRRGEALRC